MAVRDITRRSELMLNYLVALWVAWHPGMCWEVMELNQRMSPLGACITITQSIIIASSNSLTRWERRFFPSHPSLFRPLSNAGCRCRSFVFECPHLYWARKVCNFDLCKLFLISKHDLLKRLWAFVHSHLIPPLVCSVDAQQTIFRICSTYLHVCVNGRMMENIKQCWSCFGLFQ